MEVGFESGCNGVRVEVGFESGCNGVRVKHTCLPAVSVRLHYKHPLSVGLGLVQSCGPRPHLIKK